MIYSFEEKKDYYIFKSSIYRTFIIYGKLLELQKPEVKDRSSFQSSNS